MAVEAAKAASPNDAARIGRLLGRLLKDSAPLEFANQVVDTIPHGVPALASAAISAGTLILSGRARSVEQRLRRADILARLAKWSSESGRIPDALKFSGQCVRVNREISKRNPAARPRVVAATLFLAQCLSAAGHHRRAARMADEAARSARLCPPSELARRLRIAVLETKACVFLEAGDCHGALLVANRMRKEIQRAADAGLNVEEEEARSHLLMARIRSRHGDAPQTLSSATEAWTRFQSLAYQDPARFESNYLLASELASAAKVELGIEDQGGPQPGEALATVEGTRDPDLGAGQQRRMVYLARQASALLEQGSPDQAVTVAEEAAAAARELRARFGDLHASDEANVYMVLSLIRRTRGERRKALVAARRGLQRFEAIREMTSEISSRHQLAQRLANELAGQGRN